MQELRTLKFAFAKDFKEGIACVKVSNKYGYIDKTGKFIVEPSFDTAWSFSEGMASFETSGKCGYINKEGKIVIEPGFTYASDFNEGLAFVCLNTFKGDGYGFIDKEGNFVIEPTLNNAGNFSEGLAPARAEHKWGYINRDSYVVIPDKYDLPGLLRKVLRWYQYL